MYHNKFLKPRFRHLTRGMSSFCLSQIILHQIFATQRFTHHKTVIVHVEDEILTHDSQANQGNICSAKKRRSVEK